MPIPARPVLSSSVKATAAPREEVDEYIEVDEDNEYALEYQENTYAPTHNNSPASSPFALEEETYAENTEDDEEYIDYTKKYSPEILDSVDILLDAIAGDDSSEVLMNGPDNIMMKRNGMRYQIPGVDFGDAETYHSVINDFILENTDTQDRIGPKSFLVEGQLELPGEDGQPPLLARVHVVAPPVVKFAKVTIAKKSRHQYTIDDIVAHGTLTPNMGEFLKCLARGRITTVFSGLSGAGKTTLLEAMSHEFDEHDRIIVIEDTPELRIPVADTVYMTATSARPGAKPEDVVTIEWLVRATNRMRPDRIIVGEIRGGEMSEFLVAANSGADGSMTTVHAANPRMTLEKMRGLAMKAESSKNETSINREIASTVQIIVQASLVEGKHVITHIEEVSDTIRKDSGVIATTTLFEYDRATGKHMVKARPTEKLQMFLAQRGVTIENRWFNGTIAS